MLNFKKKSVKLEKEEYAYLDIGKGETVVLVHGNMSSSVHYLPLIELLKGDYRLLAPDLRGFGDTTYNNEFSSMEELADDLAEFCDALKIESAHFVSWSAGCPVTLILAAKYPQKVKSIFAIEGGSHKGYPIFKKNKEFQSVYGEAYLSKQEMAADPVQVAPVVNMFETKAYASISAVWDATIYTVNKPDKADNEIYLEETAKQRCLPDLDWSLATVNMSNEYTAYTKGDGSIEKVTCPCAFTSADKDIVVPSWMVMENVNAVKNSKLLPYVDCGHSPLVDCPEKLAKDIKEFFGS